MFLIWFESGGRIRMFWMFECSGQVIPKSELSLRKKDELKSFGFILLTLDLGL